MPVPTRSEAIRLLQAAGPSPRLLQHAIVVAEVASFLAYRAQARGVRVDRRLAETAALLHDVDKAFRDDDPLKRYPHGRAGAEYVAAAGHPELARAVASHPVMRLGDDDAEAWLADSPL
jgi:putative nucleotidyltransferase with HDIG domain